MHTVFSSGVSNVLVSLSSAHCTMLGINYRQRGGARLHEHAPVNHHTPGQVFQDVPVLISPASYKHVSVHPHQCGSVESAMKAWIG